LHRTIIEVCTQRQDDNERATWLCASCYQQIDELLAFFLIGSKREEWSDFRATSDQSARRVSSTAIDCLKSCSPSCFFHQYLVNWHVFRKCKSFNSMAANFDNYVMQ